MPSYTKYYGTFEPTAEGKQVDYVDLVVCVDDTVCRDANNQDVPFYFTDLQFQPGSALTGWVPHTQEMLAKKTFINDETVYLPSNYTCEGRLPTTWNMEHRWFNILGRGHQVITLPNYYPEDWDVEVLPSGVDFTIYPKEAFDLCRISTSAGMLLERGDRAYDALLDQYPEDSYIQDLFNEHPLHYRYTREFWVDGASAGTEIKVHASTRIAKSGGVDIPIAGQRYIDVNGKQVYIGRRRFLMAPTGSARFRIEFYKVVNLGSDYGNAPYLKDIGIGFYGTASFTQWTYGYSRI